MKVVLSGSGVKYFVHIGALKALEEHARKTGDKITHICGTSGGSIVAALYASGWGFDPITPGYRGDLAELAYQLLPSKYIDYRWMPWSKPYGLISTRGFTDVFQSLMVHQFKNCFVDLSVVTVDLEAGEHVVWNVDNPIHIPSAVTASMAIPLVFEYQKLNNRVHVDGGVAANFPLDIYGTGSDVYGITIRSTKSKNDVSSIKGFVTSVIDTMIGASEREHIEDATFARMIPIPVDYPTTGFNVTRNDAERMVKLGYTYTNDYIKLESN